MKKRIPYLSTSEFWQRCRNNPDYNYVMFTHVYGSWYTPDHLIRKGLAMKYDVDVNETFSHTGSVWYDEENNWPGYWHQTYPIFKRERWKTRDYSIAVEITDPEVVEFARECCTQLYERKSGYAIGQLLSFAFTLWFSWFNNPIKVGQVCSESVARSYPSIITREPDNADPQIAYEQLEATGANVFRILPKN